MMTLHKKHRRQDRSGSGRLTIAPPKGIFFSKKSSHKTSVVIWLKRKESNILRITMSFTLYRGPLVALYRNKQNVMLPKPPRYFSFSGVVERMQFYLPAAFTAEDASKTTTMHWMLQYLTHADQIYRHRTIQRRVSQWTVEGSRMAARKTQLRVFEEFPTMRH